MHFFYSNNKSRLSFFILMFFIFFIFFLNKSIFLLLPLSILFYLNFNKKLNVLNFKNITIISFTLILFFLFHFLQYKFNFNLLKEFINITKIRNLRNLAVQYININYKNSDISDLVKLILFNIKTGFGITLYNNLKLLSVAHIIVVSGLHLNFLINFINFIFRKKIITVPINILSLFIVSSFLNFSISSIRVTLTYIISLYPKMKDKSEFTKVWLSAVIIIFFGPNQIFNLGFQMSFLSTIAILLVCRIYKKAFLKNLLINFSVNVYIFPLIIKITNKFSLWSFLYSLLFSWIYIFNFFSFLFFAIPGIENLYIANLWITKNSMHIFLYFNVSINLKEMKASFILIYYLIIFYFSYIICKFKKTY